MRGTKNPLEELAVLRAQAEGIELDPLKPIYKSEVRDGILHVYLNTIQRFVNVTNTFTSISQSGTAAENGL